jgi:hypothetical protein
LLATDGGAAAALSTDWSTRVVANGGALPSTNTISAIETLRTGLISAGLTNKIYSLCIFVPDSLTAALTPLIKHKGFDPWGNSNFVSGDLNIQGLVGNGTSKNLETGVKAKNGEAADNTDGSRGLSVLISEGDFNREATAIGYRDSTGSISLFGNVGASGSTAWYPTLASDPNRLITEDGDRVGYVSFNVTTNGTTNAQIFVASTLEAHKLRGTLVLPSVTATTTENTISVFASKVGITNFYWSAYRMAMACVHDGFSQAESSNFWWLVKTCRESLGGGVGDPVQEWSRKVALFGGAAPSTTTSNALRTFYSALDTDGTLYKAVAYNAMVPDSLTACLVPLIWQSGNPIWTNINFGATNLSVNGLQGNGSSKYLQAYVTNGWNARGWNNNSAGFSVLLWANPDTGGNGIVGSAQATDQMGLFSFGGTGLFRCWKTTGVNADFVSASVSPQTNGWLCGSRTANNAIAMYKARGDQVHTLVTNATGASTAPGAALLATGSFAFALNNGGTPAAYSPATMSFIGFHSGMTQTENSNLYVRVSTLRTALGGGSP